MGSGQDNILILIFIHSKTIDFFLLYRSFRCPNDPYKLTGILEVRNLASSFELDGRLKSYASVFLWIVNRYVSRLSRFNSCRIPAHIVVKKIPIKT